MILKYLLIALAVVITITASDPYFGTELTHPKIPKDDAGDVRELAWMSTDAFRDYLMDHDDRVDDLFDISPFYYPNVHFWFLIYTQFESSQVVIHDKVNLSLIYKILDFSSLQKKDVSKNIMSVLQRKLTEEKVDSIKKELDLLIKNPFSLEPGAKNIYRIVKHSNITLPLKKLERAAFFREMRDNIRSQTGQKNYIREGVIRSLPYQPFLSKYFKGKNLPPELLAVPFLESSFNPRAESKVGALGVWQFMPLIASFYVPQRTQHVDYRSNVGVASVSAAYLMSENFKIMKSWDLAVTAYNSGTKHLLKSKRELASTEADLEDIIKHSDSAHFGFASKNFYSEFLALTRTLAYREELFEEIHKHDRYNVEDELRFFISKCSMRLDKVLNEKELDDVKFHNTQIKEYSVIYPRGLILSTKETLPKSKFIELPFEKILKIKPKDWSKLLGNQSCSTR